MNNKKTKSTPQKKTFLYKIRLIIGVSFILFSFIMLVSFISYLANWQEAQSQLGNWLDKSERSSNYMGKLGDWLGNTFLFDSFGITSFVIALLVFMIGSLVLKLKIFKPLKTLSHSLFFLCWMPIFLGAITKGKGILSGIYGFQIYDYLNLFIGSLGVWTILITGIGLYFILEFNIRPNSIKAKIAPVQQKFHEFIENFTPEEEEKEPSTAHLTKDTPPITETQENLASDSLTLTNNSPEIESNATNTMPLSNEQPEKETEITFKNTNNSEPKNNPIVEFPTEPASPASSKPQTIQGEPEIEISIEKTPVVEISDEEKSNEILAKHGQYDHKLELAKFQMPSLDFLKDYGDKERTPINKEELEENKNRIINILRNFKVGIAQIKATIGPTVTLYEIVPEAGTKVSTIKNLQDDIALNLSALGIRIIAPIPGKGTIGIEVPNQSPTIVSMRSVLTSPKFQNTTMELPIAFGKTISNEIFMADLAKMPHLLMAGATGQGKSVGINAILASLLYKKHPSELKFVMVDPKKVELSLYSKIERHYLAKLPDTEEAILTDTSKVVHTLNSLCVEMDNRYELLKNVFCRNIIEYNKKFSNRQLNPEKGHRYLPYIVLIVDEFADLIMTAGKEVEHPIARLAQLARAVGIHLIIATQRPSVNIITGMIKANFPARVSFRVNAGVDSKTILDTTGAEQLIGRGDMLYSNGNDITRVQCAFIDTPEVENIAEFIGEQTGYAHAYELPEFVGEDNGNGSNSFDPDEKDPLFEEAARIVVATQQGSTSMLQRQLKLGYNRAGRIVDQLEASGILGAFNGSKAREVLIQDPNALEQFLDSLRK